MPLLFLSHAGADTERALRVAAAIEASPDAQQAGLRVWVDKRPDGPDRLLPGTPWQDQLEAAIDTRSTAFAILLTKAGARHWVRMEVRVALDRVIAEQRKGGLYPFVPVFEDDPALIGELPAFARQHQGVRLGPRAQGLADLVRIAAGLDAARPVRLVAEPFKGLAAFEAEDADLFFGRTTETRDLVDQLRRANLVAVVGDSGSGKSSLVKAGLVPAFREGALADPGEPRPEPSRWHVVEMRPGRDPFESLVDGIAIAAREAGKPDAERGALYEWVRSRQAPRIRDALRDSGPPGASLLLVVDQLEELWTLTADDRARVDFIVALLALTPAGDMTRRVVATMRRDYWHLHTDDEALRLRLADAGQAGRFLLAPISDAGLREAVEKPLLLAGEADADARALADDVVRDIQGQPGNLALVEMALQKTWERRRATGASLRRAYRDLDCLEGALAQAATDAYAGKLTDAERPVAEALFMRLVRAGDAGGVTRRPVGFDEIDAPAREVARRLAGKDLSRLLVLREPEAAEPGPAAGGPVSVELAHEQLATQWPEYRHWLTGVAVSGRAPDPTRRADKRTLDRLMDDAAAWARQGGADDKDDLVRGVELDAFDGLRQRRPTWLTSTEARFVERSIAGREAARRERDEQLRVARELAASRQRQLWGSLAALVLLVAVAGFAWLQRGVAWRWTRKPKPESSRSWRPPTRPRRGRSGTRPQPAPNVPRRRPRRRSGSATRRICSSLPRRSRNRAGSRTSPVSKSMAATRSPASCWRYARSQTTSQSRNGQSCRKSGLHCEMPWPSSEKWASFGFTAGARGQQNSAPQARE